MSKFIAAFLLLFAAASYPAQAASSAPQTAYPVYGAVMCYEKPDLSGLGKEIRAEKFDVEKSREVGGALWFYGNVSGRKLWVPESDLSFAAPEAKQADAIAARLAKALEKFSVSVKSDSSWMRCPDVKLPGKGSSSTWTHKDAVVQPEWYCAFRTNKMCAEFMGMEPIGLTHGELDGLMGASGGWNAPDLAVYSVPNTEGDSVFFRFKKGKVAEAGWKRDAPSDVGAGWQGWRLWDLRVYRGDIPDSWPKRAECTGSSVNIRKGPSGLSGVLGKIQYKNYPLRTYGSIKRGGQTWTLVDGGIGLRGWMSGKYVKESRSDRKSRFENAFSDVFMLHKVYLANVLGEKKPVSVKTGKKDARGYQIETTAWKKSSETTRLGKMDALIDRVAVTAPGISVCGLQVGDRITDGAGRAEPYFEQFIGGLESCGWKRNESKQLEWERSGHYFTITPDNGGERIVSMNWGEKIDN